jgi:hypothetical protein
MSEAALKISAACALSLLMLAANAACAQEFQTALQVSPQGGGHCIEVPGSRFVQDQGLQMMDCNGAAAQLFAYDPTRMRLAIGGLCVDANGGKPGDLVKLSSCNGGAGQTWRAQEKGEFTKLVGAGDLCLDIRYGSTEKGAPLQSWTCGEAEPNQLWRLLRK